MFRCDPNILIAGLPENYKTAVAKEVASRTGMDYISVAEVAADNGCFRQLDEASDYYVLDEAKLLRCVAEEMLVGGNVVDFCFYGFDIFPEKWIDAVFLLGNDSQIPNDRHLQEIVVLSNNAEMHFHPCMQAFGSYDPAIVHRLQGSGSVDLEQNISSICTWVNEWLQEHEEQESNSFF